MTNPGLKWLRLFDLGILPFLKYYRKRLKIFAHKILTVIINFPSDYKFSIWTILSIFTTYILIYEIKVIIY